HTGLFGVRTNQRNQYLKLTKLVSRLFTKIVRIIKELIRKTRASADQERAHFQIIFWSVCRGCSPSKACTSFAQMSYSLMLSGALRFSKPRRIAWKEG
ncbi:hypothetical protein FRX31_011201, partial [Thalictrum thalictroides]